VSGTAWIRLTSIDNIPVREGRSIAVGAHELAVFNLGDRFLAVDGRCPHRGGPLADGIVAGETVVCPLHAWKVSLRTGGVERPSGVPACVRAYETKVEHGIVNVRLDCEPTHSAIG
jgi:nitrite reductase (NADH) small subunit